MEHRSTAIKHSNNKENNPVSNTVVQ